MHSRSGSIKAILQPMPKVTGSLRTKFEESFIIKAAKLWNTLPPKVTQITDLIHFKAGLDKFLCDIPDLPPVPGYPYQNNNSLTSISNNRFNLVTTTF